MQQHSGCTLGETNVQSYAVRGHMVRGELATSNVRFNSSYGGGGDAAIANNSFDGHEKIYSCSLTFARLREYIDALNVLFCVCWWLRFVLPASAGDWSFEPPFRMYGWRRDCDPGGHRKEIIFNEIK